MSEIDETWQQLKKGRIAHCIIPIAAVLAVLLASGCSLSSGNGSLGGTAGILQRLQPLTDGCDGPLNGYDAIDLSATGRGDAALTEERLEALRNMADQVAACGGYMKVVGFSSSRPETFTLGESELPTSSGTETARLLQADKAESSLLDEVEERMATAERHLTPNGSDVLAQLELAQQYQEQRSSGKLYVEIETDGIATTKPVVMNTPQFTIATARASAQAIDVPDLTGATVHLVGIGKTSGSRLPHTEKVEAITRFYSIACERTNAQCMVTTDSTKEG